MLDTTQLKTVLENAQFPVPVKKWEIDMGPDATGDESIWVWAVLDDSEFADEKRAWPVFEQIRTSIRNAISSAFNGAAPWIYIRFRALSEV